MGETRQHTNSDSKALFDYTSLASMDDCAEFMVWLSERDINIIWQAVLNIERFRSRVYTEKHGTNYTIATQDEFSEFKVWVSDMNVHMGDYLVCNELLSDIKDAILALAERECCPGGGVGGGSMGAGLDGAAPSVITSTPTDREGDPPPSAESWAEFDQKKCNIAHYIIDQMKGDIATMGLIAAGKASAVALATAAITALFTPVGWAILIGLAALTLELIVIGFELASLITFLEDNKNELVCAMLDGDNVTDSINSFGTAIDELVPEDGEISGYGTIAVYLAKRYFKTFATSDSFNRLYDGVPYEIPGGKDCSDCFTPDWAILEGGYGSGNTNANPMILSGALVSGRYRLYLCRAEGSDDVTFTSQAGYTPSPTTGGSDDSITVDSQNCSGSVTGDLYLDDDFPTSTTFNGAAWIGFNSTTPFTVTLDKA